MQLLKKHFLVYCSTLLDHAFLPKKLVLLKLLRVEVIPELFFLCSFLDVAEVDAYLLSFIFDFGHVFLPSDKLLFVLLKSFLSFIALVLHLCLAVELGL